MWLSSFDLFTSITELSSDVAAIMNLVVIFRNFGIYPRQLHAIIGQIDPNGKN